MEKYHKYVFDLENRKFVGKFEKMYQNESKEIFDSWHQEDSRQIQRKITLSILEGYNFNFIIDIGCGKGALTHCLKKKNNKVIGIDISKTALSMAKKRYPDIDFICSNVNNIPELCNLLINIEKTIGKVDLIFTSEIFSYVKNWKEILKLISKHTKYFLLSLFIPGENPMGFVKNERDLVLTCEKYFEIIERITIYNEKVTIIFGKIKNEFL